MLNDIKRTRLILVILFRGVIDIIWLRDWLLEICGKAKDYKLCNKKEFFLIRTQDTRFFLNQTYTLKKLCCKCD